VVFRVGSIFSLKSFSRNKQIEKLNRVEQMADRASQPNNGIEIRLGALLLRSGLADYRAIQAARLAEQLVLKGQVAQGLTPKFQPHWDDFFFSKQVRTSRILSEIRKMLPFSSKYEDLAGELTKLAHSMVKCGFEFLESRNIVIHHIGNPTETMEGLLIVCDEANQRYLQFREAHRAFFTKAQPFGFSEQEINRFYGGDLSKHDILF
jgi:hypothetical protein